MPATIVLSSAYLGPVEYYSKIFHYKTIVEQFEHYTKQSYFNRCHIATPEGVLALSIPIVKESGKTPIRDIKISEHAPWQRTHWRAIKSAYSTTPFFEYYADDLIPFFEKRWNFLFDFNMSIQTTVLELLGMDTSINLTDNYETDFDNKKDWRNKIHPKNNHNIENGFIINQYYQVFMDKTGFIPNLSIIDLLFNMGNEARIILKNSEKLN